VTLSRRREHSPVNPVIPQRKRGIRGPAIQRVHITPELARVWMGFGTPRQPIDVPKMNKFAADMKSGRWQDNRPDETWISFDHAGRLTNGHHRLRAIVKSGTAVEFWVRNRPWIPR
jgi:hypothetical protein